MINFIRLVAALFVILFWSIIYNAAFAQTASTKHALDAFENDYDTLAHIEEIAGAVLICDLRSVHWYKNVKRNVDEAERGAFENQLDGLKTVADIKVFKSQAIAFMHARDDIIDKVNAAEIRENARGGDFMAEFCRKRQAELLTIDKLGSD